MNDKTAILSLRISEKLKRKIEAEARNQSISMTDYIRKIISDTHGEKLVLQAQVDIKLLEDSAKTLNTRLSELSERQNKLLDDMEARVGRISHIIERVSKATQKDRFMSLIIVVITVILVSTGVAILGSWYYKSATQPVPDRQLQENTAASHHNKSAKE